MQRIISFIKKYEQPIGAIVIFIGIVIFVGYKMTNTKTHGLVTIAKVLRYEPAESGSELFIEIYFMNKKYVTSIGQEFQPGSFGRFFFIKIDPKQPENYPIFYADRPVPRCIIDSVKYFRGWLDFPTCENYK